MLWILYYGRLEKEKGFDSIIKAIQVLQNSEDFSQWQVEFFIFGKGSLEEELLPLVGKKVHYFGWQPLEKIQQYLPNIDYCLMPSEFLETFGLSALNALSRGLPVLWYRKGGLEPFIFADCNLFTSKGTTTAERIVSALKKLCKLDETEKREKKLNYQKQISLLLENYSHEARYQRFIELTKGKPQKVLLVSDFINKIGGIETYLHDVQDLLRSQGHEVLLRGGSVPKGPLWTLRKLAGILFSPANFWDAYRFEKLLKEYQPDLIWFNSLLRNLGPGVVRKAKKYKDQQLSSWVNAKDPDISSDTLDSSFHSEWPSLLMMYHDFGYFYPYPSQLNFVEDCKTPLTLKNFLWRKKPYSFLQKVVIRGKYLLMYPLVKVLKKQIDLHLVPSEFMREIVSKSYKLSEKKVKAFNHFIQK